MSALKCSYSCGVPVTHIDEKGFVYCEYHGLLRRACGVLCRKLRGHELKRLEAGKPLLRYRRLK